MDRDEHLKELFQPVFEKNQVNLYEMIWKQSGNEKTLEVSIIKPDGTMDLDTCASVSEQLSEVLDKDDPIPEEYTLEVCSPGAEREIRDLNELDHLAGTHVYVRLKHPFKKMMEFTGDIVSVDTDGNVVLSYRDKAATRKAEFTKDNIDFIRYAVRI